MLAMMKRMSQILFWMWMTAVPAGAAITLANDGYHVYPGDSIQDALQQAAANPTNKTVKVHAGVYRPNSKRQAMIWFNKSHEGIRLEAEGPVTLTAANPELAQPSDASFPAVVNHVVYFGDGVSSNTVLSGFRITGANNFVTKEGTRQMEPSIGIPKNYFFYSDGGAIKVFGRSSPTIRNLEIEDNFSSPCGGGISVQQQGFSGLPVLIENCIFRNNRAQGTGPAIDLLAGSAARIINCLFVGNISNMGEDPVANNSGERPFVNNGAVTIFWKSRAEIRSCTFAGNRNGVDDMGGSSTYADCIFHDNKLDAGLKGFGRYDLAVNGGAKSVTGCLFNGTIHDVAKVVPAESNVLKAPSPDFGEDYVPKALEFNNAGYRPAPLPPNPAPSAQPAISDPR